MNTQNSEVLETSEFLIVARMLLMEKVSSKQKI
jgi:hypothetical protein